MAIESFFQLYKPVPVIAVLMEDYRYVFLFFSHGGPNLYVYLFINDKFVCSYVQRQQLFH